MFRRITDWWAAVRLAYRAQETLRQQQKLVQAQQQVILLLHERLREQKAAHTRDLALLLMAAGGEVDLDGGLVDEVMSFGGEFAVDVSRPDENTHRVTLRVVEPEADKEKQ